MPCSCCSGEIVGPLATLKRGSRSKSRYKLLGSPRGVQRLLQSHFHNWRSEKGHEKMIRTRHNSNASMHCKRKKNEVSDQHEGCRYQWHIRSTRSSSNIPLGAMVSRGSPVQARSGKSSFVGPWPFAETSKWMKDISASHRLLDQT